MLKRSSVRNRNAFTSVSPALNFDPCDLFLFRPLLLIAEGQHAAITRWLGDVYDKSERKNEPDKPGARILPETNIATENRPSQKETSIPTIHFQLLC